MTLTRATAPAAILLAAPLAALLAGCGDEPASPTPTPTPRAVATWQTPTPPPATTGPAPVIVGGRCDTKGATAATAAGTKVTCLPDGPNRLSWIDLAPPTPKRRPTIDEGVWTVGVDIPPGTYRVTDPLEDECYWSITETGSNGDDIISDDVVSSGRPSVTLEIGQDFESNRCGTWERTK